MGKSNKPEESPQEEIKQQEAVKNVYAQGNISIRDINQVINQYFQKRGIEFLKHTDLKKFQSPFFPRITCLDEALDNIQKHRVLMMGGNHADKSDLAWHLAVHLQLFIQSSSDVYGWESTSNTRELIAANRKESSSTASTDKEAVKIFVLLNLNPQDIALERLKKLASEYEFFVIATTEIPEEKWSLSQSEKRSWIDSNSLSYEPQALAQATIERIPGGITLSSEIEVELHRLVIEQLHTVAGVDACIDWLRNCKQELSLDDINAAIQSAKEDKKERLKKWFRTLLPREQLLALGITLFNGLYIDQFFAALERLVRRAWQQRDPSLQALDHCDLENLGNYYEFSEVTKDDDSVLHRLNVKDPESGKLLLCIAWESHRRQIIAALEEIIQLIQDSAHGNFHAPSDWMIYGTPALQQRLYEGVSEPFAEVGLVSAEATSPIRDLLVRLAADSERAIQDFVATVLAYWYKREADKLLRTLHFFYYAAFDSRSNQQNPDYMIQQACVRATVALAVSYASSNALPKRMHPKLRDWLTTLSSSKIELVRRYFGSHTLSYVVPRHLPQIGSILKEIAEKQNDLSLEIAQSLASAYSNYSDEVIEYLKIWSQDSRKRNLLCTVARTYGLINCSIHFGKLTPQSAFEQLQTLLQEEERLSIRRAVIEGMSDRLRQDCSVIAPMLLAQVSKITKPERDHLVTHLTKIYLAQREQLTGSEDFYEINEVYYPVWINIARPLTEIETVLLQWLGQTQNRTAQQIATQAAIEFARALDIDEDTELSQLRNLQFSAVSEDEDSQEDKGDNSEPWHENWLAPVAAWFATLPKAVYQPVVRNILPEVLVHHKDYRAGLDFVLRKWEQSPNQSLSNSLKLKPTAIFLRRGLWMMNSKVFLMGSGASIAVGLMGMYMVGRQIINTNKNAVIPHNESLIITVPDNKTVNEDSDLKIGGIGIEDPEGKDGEEVINVTLSVTKGSLQVTSSVAQLKTNDSSSSVTLKGKISAINASLADSAAITYRGNQNYNGSDSLKIQVDNSGKEAEQVMAITVNSVNHAPTIAASQSAKRVPENPVTTPQFKITEEEALNVVRSYLQAKRKFFAPPFPREMVARYTTGKFYNGIVEEIDSLIKQHRYHQYGKQQPKSLKSLDFFGSSYNKASIRVVVTEDLTEFYADGKHGEVKDSPRRYRFDLKLDNGAWKISERVPS